MKIVPFKESDAEAVARLSNENSEFFQYPNVKPDYLKCMCSNPSYKMFILEDAGKVAGFCGVNCSNACVVEIGPICVSKALRDKGFGHKLVSRAIRHIGKIRPAHVIIKVKASNIAGQEFFKSLGFSPIAAVEVNGEPAIIMEKISKLYGKTRGSLQANLCTRDVVPVRNLLQASSRAESLHDSRAED